MALIGEEALTMADRTVLNEWLMVSVGSFGYGRAIRAGRLRYIDREFVFESSERASDESNAQKSNEQE